MATQIKINVIGKAGDLLCSATCTTGTGSKSSATQNEVIKTISREVTTANEGTVELIIDGKAHTMPITTLKAAWEADWGYRGLDPLVPMNTSRTYTGCDATTASYVTALGRGVNLGQMWEAVLKAPNNPRPGAFRDLRITPEILRRFKLAGFDHVRIPCNWARQADGAAPYTISAAQMTRYKQDVDAAIAAGFKVIINQHHSHLVAAWTGWASENGGSLSLADMLVRQQAIIVQVAQAFSSYPADKLFLEIENEPHVDSGANGSNPGWTDARWESYWPGAITAIRAVAPNMIILLGGTNYNSTTKLSAMAPITDTKTVLMAHPYEPNPTFTHQFSGSPLWTLVNKALLQSSIDAAYAQSVARGLPCVMSEVGANFYIPRKHRMMHARDAANMCATYGMPYTYWNGYGGGMDIFHITKGSFIPGMVEALTGVTPPTFYSAIPPSGNILDWSMAYWGIGTSGAAQDVETTVTVTGDTLTFNNAGNHVAYYVPTKGVDLTPGTRFRFTISGSGGGGATKMLFYKLGPQIGNWDGLVSYSMPNPANASSTPAWGDHGFGTYEYVVPDVYPDDQTHTEVDPWGFRFLFTGMVVGATRTIIVTKVS